MAHRNDQVTRDKLERLDSSMAQSFSVARETAADDASGEPSWSRGMIQVECRGAVARLTLNRQEKLNAIERAFWKDLLSALEWIESQGVRAIIFTGASDRAFSVGGDIGSFAALTTDDARRSFQTEAMEAFEAIANCPIPTIAAVNGLALGGGCEIAMACDFVLAARSATLGLPEARFGLVPGYGVLAAPAAVGVQMAKLLIFTGESVTAEEALRCGLIQRLCEDGDLQDEAFGLAQKIAEASPHAIAAGKAMLGKRIDAKAIAQSIDMISDLHATAESRSAVASFLEKHRHSARDAQ